MNEILNYALDGIAQNPADYQDPLAQKADTYQRAINRILRSPIDGEFEPQDWQRVKAVQSLLEARLQEMGMRLVVVDSDRVCFLTNLTNSEEDEQTYNPFRSTNLSRTSSILLLIALQKYLQSEGEIEPGLRRFRFDDIAAAMLPYENVLAVEITRQFQSKVRQSLKELEQLKILRSNEHTRARGEETVYEVRPLIRHLADHQKISDLRLALNNYLNAQVRDDSELDRTANETQEPDQQGSLDIN